MTAAATTARQRGMTLIEAIATIALIGLAVLIATSLTAVYPGNAERVAARHELLRVADATLEGVRCGHTPLQDGAVPVPIPVAREIALQLGVEALEPAGLYNLSVSAGTEVRGETLTITLQTMLWRPE